MITVICLVGGMLIGGAIVLSVFLGIAKYMEWKRKREMLPYQKYKLQIEKFKK